MIQSLKLKPDFARTVERFEAWWVGEIVDRPPVSLGVSPSRPYCGPKSSHRTLRERWFDVEFIVASAIASLEQHDYPADNLPVFWPNLGPEITATLFGCELEFGADTSWSVPVVHEPADWERIIASPPDFGNPYWQTLERLTDRAIELCDGRYLVGLSDLHGSYDILAALRDPQALCLDILDCPGLVQRAGRHAAHAFVESFHRSYRKLAGAGFGSICWTPAYYAGPGYVPSCDFWCMVSPAVARDLILPELLVEMAPFERSIFHLDGPQALQHLDLLLDLPQLNAVQWVYGAGRGPAAKWIDVYRRIRRAGKSVQVIAANPRDALTVLEQLGPQGLWLCVESGCANRAEADAFLKQVERTSTLNVQRSTPNAQRRR